jgi:hypothetical protein
MIENLLKINTKLLLALSMSMLLIQSCSKEQENGTKPGTVARIQTPEKLAAEKFERIKTFLTIVYGTPANKLRYNAAAEEFTYGDNGQYKEKKANIEAMYDIANEYKLKYEK